MSMSPPISYGPTDIWVIPNGHGGLWTPMLFRTAEEARRRSTEYWGKGKEPPEHAPRLARIMLTAQFYDDRKDAAS